MLENYAIPAHIERMKEGASQEDAYRLHLHGLMLATGVIPRTSTTDALTGITTVPIRFQNSISLDEMKQLVTEYYRAAWGAEEVKFFQSQKDRRISTEDVMYFHVSFKGKYLHHGAKATD